ncbi:MAG: glutamine--tRNA ligase/YqeY domain fusion protein [Labilithrix sp.]|nr:glutamine--tRNA ligase/YqeY domain fusion protein [Labilithrix sp.]
MAEDFIREMIRADVAAGKHGGKVVTRFPPEPNGHLHIGHSKAICIDFGVAREFGGRCHLRMDDTNPTTEDVAYVEAIKRDVKWLGFDWGEHLYYASDYFERYYELGELLIRRGRAYVCDLSDEEFSASYRGTITEPGKESPYRGRTASENLDLFRRMRKGEFKDGERVLRAKIDMASPNMKMRDPPLVRIKHAHHYRTGDAWCIYPLYDYAHCLEDSFEGVTHSLCTMEFESARELYDWVIQATEVPHVPKQTEFARLNLTYTVMSKRRLLQLVEQKHVSGWDDPRMPTLAGLRRRGYTPESIRDFVAKIGVAKNLSTVDVALLESCVRDDLDRRSPRVMAVLRPLELVVESFPEGEVEQLDASYWPQGGKGSTEPAETVPAEVRGSRKLPFSRRLYVDREDFAEVPPEGWKRMAPGRQVRLRHGYIVTCTRVEKENDEVVRVFCTHDPKTRGGASAEGARSLGTIHWVSAAESIDVEVRLYDRLFKSESPGEGTEGDWLADLNPASLSIVKAKAEPSLAAAKAGDRFQLERVGFFFADPDSAAGAPVLNRTVPLKDGWAKVVAKASPAKPEKRESPKTTTPAVPVALRSAAVNAVVDLSPEAKALVAKHGLGADAARVLSQEAPLRALFESALATEHGESLKGDVASLLVNELLGEMRSRKLDAVPFGGAAIVELVSLVDDKTISNKQAKEVLAEMFTGEAGPRAIVEAKGMKQIASADALGPIVDEVLAANADAVARYKAGNANVFGAIVGMVMKQTKGQGNPKLVASLLKQRLDG